MPIGCPMIHRLTVLFLISWLLVACTAARTLEPAAESLPPGITPLTLEQDRMIDE